MGDIIIDKSRITREAALEMHNEILSGFVHVGDRLAAMKRCRGYLTLGYSSWDEYCRVAIRYSTRHSDRLIAATNTARKLVDAPADKFLHHERRTPPLSHLLELNRVPAAQRPDVYKDVRDECEDLGVPVTAACVQAYVDRWLNAPEANNNVIATTSVAVETDDEDNDEDSASDDDTEDEDDTDSEDATEEPQPPEQDQPYKPDVTRGPPVKPPAPLSWEAVETAIDRYAARNPGQAPVIAARLENKAIALRESGIQHPRVKVAFTLDTPAFRAKWTEWLDYRRTKGMALSDHVLQDQMDHLATLDHDGAINQLEQWRHGDAHGIDSFDAWWQAYPRKVGKLASASSWAKTIKRLHSEYGEQAAAWLLERTRLFAQSKRGQAGPLCPHPTTWLNQGRYDDDPSEWDKVSMDGKRAPHPTGAGHRHPDDHRSEGEF